MEKASSFHGSRGDVTDSATADAIDEDKHKKLSKIREKMKKTMDRISVEQRRKEENVNTYLKASSTHSPSGPASQTNKAKADFEKRNQKCTQTIDSLQRKLEDYKKKANELERMTPAQYAELSANSANSFPRDSNGLRSRKNVLHGLKGMGAGIKEGITGSITGGLSTGIRAKEYVSQLLQQKNAPRSTSADHLDRINDRVSIEETDRQSTPGSNTLPARFDLSFKYASEDEDDNLSSLTGSESHGPYANATVPAISKPADTTPGDLSPQRRRRYHAPRSRETAARQRDPGDYDEAEAEVAESGRSVDIATNQKIMDLNNIVDSLVAENLEIRAALQEYKEFHQNEVTAQRRKIEDLSFTTTLLDEQCNNITELRKADLENYAQTIEGIEEKLFYQANERTQDFQEALESTQTRITKMEMQLQQQRVNLIEGFETGTDFRNLLTKIANVFISLITVIFVFINIITTTCKPFVSTRYRAFLVSMILVCCYLIHHWKHCALEAIYGLAYGPS